MRDLLEGMAAFLVVAFVLLFGWVTIAPYFLVIPIESQQLIVQQITTIQNVMLAVVAFFFGQSSGNLKKDATISSLVKNPPPPAQPPLEIKPGDSVKITTATEITGEPPP
jgi:hypothetical protein